MDTPQEQDTRNDDERLADEALGSFIQDILLPGIVHGARMSATEPITPEMHEGIIERVAKAMRIPAGEYQDRAAKAITIQVVEQVGADLFHGALAIMGGRQIEGGDGGMIVALDPAQFIADLPWQLGIGFLHGLLTGIDAADKAHEYTDRLLAKFDQDDEASLGVSKRDVAGGEYLISLEMGREAPDSPMVGAAMYGSGETLELAARDLFAEEDERAARRKAHDERAAEQQEAEPQPGVAAS